MSQLNKIDQLWVRACKSKDSEKRLHSVYRRFYLGDFPSHNDMALILTQILFKCVDTMDESMFSNIMDHSTTNTRMVGGHPMEEVVTKDRTTRNQIQWLNRKRALISEIRHLPVDNLLEAGYIRPVKYRRKT